MKAIPLIVLLSFSWFAGAVYDGPTRYAQTLQMDVTLPEGFEEIEDCYYVLLSAWDSNSSYLQLGISSYAGSWGIVYSWTTTNAEGYMIYHFQAHTYTLEPSTTYTFIITVSDGVAHFLVTHDSSVIWNVNATTGGNYLILSTRYTNPYNNQEAIGFALYEEVIRGAPNFDFLLRNIIADGKPVTTWLPYLHDAPEDLHVSIRGSELLIQNPRFPLASVPLIFSIIMLIISSTLMVVFPFVRIKEVRVEISKGYTKCLSVCFGLLALAFALLIPASLGHFGSAQSTSFNFVILFIGILIITGGLGFVFSDVRLYQKLGLRGPLISSSILLFLVAIGIFTTWHALNLIQRFALMHLWPLVVIVCFSLVGLSTLLSTMAYYRFRKTLTGKGNIRDI